MDAGVDVRAVRARPAAATVSSRSRACADRPLGAPPATSARAAASASGWGSGRCPRSSPGDSRRTRATRRAGFPSASARSCSRTAGSASVASVSRAAALDGASGSRWTTGSRANSGSTARSEATESSRPTRSAGCRCRAAHSQCRPGRRVPEVGVVDTHQHGRRGRRRPQGVEQSSGGDVRAQVRARTEVEYRTGSEGAGGPLEQRGAAEPGSPARRSWPPWEGSASNSARSALRCALRPWIRPAVGTVVSPVIPARLRARNPRRKAPVGPRPPPLRCRHLRLCALRAARSLCRRPTGPGPGRAPAQRTGDGRGVRDRRRWCPCGARGAVRRVRSRAGSCPVLLDRQARPGQRAQELLADWHARLGRRRRRPRRQAAQRADPLGSGEGPRRHLRQAADPAVRRVPPAALARRGDQRGLDVDGPPGLQPGRRRPARLRMGGAGVGLVTCYEAAFDWAVRDRSPPAPG
ncbi:hypothetical protein SGRIM128S_00145 [Streptomyces griseomycini]